jgi:hypothetical protein
LIVKKLIALLIAFGLCISLAGITGCSGSTTSKAKSGDSTSKKAD